MERKQYQFELWQECNSKCEFCYLGENNGFTSDEDKISNINSVLEIIGNNNLYEEINCLAYIGGEFFQGQMKNIKVKEKFLELMEKTNSLLESKLIDETWICATLNIGDQKDLFDSLQKFSDKSKIWILTSYDTIGRFHSEKMLNTWKENLHKLKSMYPEININVTSILTGDFIDKYLSDELDLIPLISEYGCSLFLKPTCPIEHKDGVYSKEETNKIVPNFFPTRKKFLSFLYKYKSKESQSMYNKLFNINLRSDYLFKFNDKSSITKLHRIKDKSQEIAEIGSVAGGELPCGHSTQYGIYIDTDEHCAICDKEMIKNLK